MSGNFKKIKVTFSENLLSWYTENKRGLPWRKTNSPYKIWVSEVMLQQTQVDTVIPYYNRFLERFPDLAVLAQASLDDVLKQWEGLGYYARARNLHKAASEIFKEHDCKMPDNYVALLKILGIGPYTAAAVASIAFNEDVPVVDGNVYRVLARVNKISEPITSAAVKRKFAEIAAELLPAGRASDFNQAMMELGALICTSRKPKCESCPVSFCCAVKLANENPELLPTKKVSIKKPHYNIAVGIIHRKGEIFIDQRPAKGLLGGLWEFPGGKQEAGESLEECVAREIQKKIGLQIKVKTLFLNVKHAYTHFKITLYAYNCEFVSGQPDTKLNWRWVGHAELPNYAFPKSNKKIVDKITGMNNEH